MKVSLQPHGNKYKLFPLVDEDQALYIEQRAKRDRVTANAVVRQAIDLMMRVEPLAERDEREPVVNGGD